MPFSTISPFCLITYPYSHILTLPSSTALHFHLTVGSSTSTPSTAFEDTELIYQPLLDEQRDKELLDLLPDYLTEEICFPRGQAPKFYRKVLDSMARKVVLEEESEGEE